MADVLWIGAAASVPQVDTITVGSATAAQTFAVTVNGKTVTYTAGSGETTATVAAALLALLTASEEGEFKERTWAASTAATNKITSAGPADGCPITTTVGGTGTISVATTTSPVSPHDAANTANYSTGSLPGGSDRLVLQDSDVDILYGLDALAAVACTFYRRSTFTGRVGLPDVNAAGGYREYRRTYLQIDGTAVTFEQGQRDGAGQFRLESVAGSAVTVIATGGGSNAQVGGEVLEVTGLPASSVVDVTGTSVAIAPKLGQTATVGTLLAANSTIRVGPGTTLAGPSLMNANARIDASWSGTLTLDGGTVVVGGAAAGVVVIEGGTLRWLSTGNPGNSPVVGSNAVFDLSQAPKALTIGGTIAAYASCKIDDSAGRGGSYSLNTVHCTLAEVTWLTANNRAYAMS